LPADPEALRQAFYEFYGAKTHAANVAWNRALRESDLELFQGKYDAMP